MTLQHPTSGRFLAYHDGAAFHLVELRYGMSMLGRTPLSVISLDGAGIAQRHAMVLVSESGEVELVDDRSPCGTWVDGERVWQRRLRSGDTIRLGNATIGFVATPGLPTSNPARARAGARTSPAS